MNKLTHGATRLLVLALGLGLVSTVWAATPVAEWGLGGFPVSAAGSYDNMTATSGDYTISKNNGYNISTANFIQVAPSSVGGGWPVVISSTDLGALTVVVAFSLDEDASGSLVGLTTGRGANKVYSYLENGAMYAGWNNGENHKYGNLSTTVPTDGTIHYLVLAYGKTAGTQMFYDGVSKYSDSGLKQGDSSGTNGNTSEITFGAQRGPQQIINGVKFHYVAVYDSKLGDSDAGAAYVRAFENINGATRTIDITADGAFDSLTGFADLAGNAASWSAGNNLFVTVPAAAADTVTLTLPTGGLDAGSLLKLDVAEGKTLVLSGSLSATSVVVTGAGAVDFSAATVTGTVKGDGTVVYSGVVPTRGLGWTDASAWTGTVWVKNKSGVTGNNNATTGIQFNTIGNSNSKVKVSGITGWLEAPVTVNPEVVLDDDTYGFALKLSDAYSPQSPSTSNGENINRATTFTKLSGAGTLMNDNDNGNANAWPVVVVNDASGFNGTINVGNAKTCLNVAFLAANETFAETSYYAYFNAHLRSIYVSAGSSVSVAAGKTWTAANGIAVKGTLTLAGAGSTISGTVTGSGTVVCNQVDLSGSGFDNASGWTGKVQIAGDTTIVPSTSFAQSSYGNANSTLEVISGSVALTTATTLPGTVNVASGSTLFVTSGTTSLSIVGTNNGTVNLGSASSLATLSLSDGIARGTVVYPSALTTLNLTLKENLADDKVVTFSVGNGTTLTNANVSLYKPDGSLNNTAVVTLSNDGHSVSVSYTPTVSGSAAWCAYEFTSNLNNSGNDTTALSADGSFTAETSVDGDGKLYTYSHPWRNITYPSDGNWSAMVRCTVPKLAEALVVAFGTQSGGIIGLASGATPDTEMRVVQGISSDQSHYLTNGVMSVLNGTTAQHVYVFTVAGNQTVKVYCDNELINTVEFPSRFTIGGGIQIGSVHGGISYGLKRCWQGDSDYSTLSEADQKAARVDSMRLYKGVLGPNAIAQLSEEFPAVKLFEATISGGNDNVWDTLAWTGGDISTINAYSKAIITVEDDATLTLPASITADELVINVVSGKTLTLVEAAGGTTLTIGQAVRRPIEVNTGSVAFDASSTTLAFGIGGTGSVFVDAGKTISVASGGSLTKLAGSGTVTYASYGSLPGALTFGNWTGTVVLPSFEANGVNFSNYGKSGSTVALTGITGGWLGETSAGNASVAPALRLDGNVTIAGFSTSWAYTFAEITGTGNLSFAPADNHPGSLAITKVAEGYSGTISNATDKNLAIGTLDRASGTTVTAGSKVLSTSSNVSASALTVAGVATGIIPVYDTDGLYVKAASVTKNDTTTYYDTVSAATTAAGTDAATIKLLMPTDGAVTLAPGQTLINGNLASGGVTGPNGYEVVNNNGTYTLVDNTASTWADAEDHKWNTATNWSTGYCPSQYTTVTFPASESAHVVKLERNSGNPRHYCASMVLNGDVEFQRNGSDWVQVYLCGNVTGPGKLKLVQAGLKLPDGGAATISCPVVCNAASNDNFFSGSDSGNETFTFSGAVDIVAGELKADYAHLVFNGPVTIRNGAYIKSNGNSTADTTFNGGIIVPESAAASLTVVNNGGAHTIASTVTLGLGATLTIPNSTVTNNATFVASAQGYHVVSTVSGATTVYSVEAIPSSAEIGEATFEYGVDFTNATVTVAVTETNASGVEYTLAIGGKNYTASAVGGTTVTFNNVEIPRGAAYGTVSYEIASTASATTGTTSGSAAVADVIAAGWINENATTHGLASAGGVWTNAAAVTYSDGKATISDNRFVATEASTASRVVLEFEVCFSSTSEEDVSGEAQAAIKLGEVDSATTFMVLTTANAWEAVSNAELTPDASETYKVVLTIDYGNNAYGVTVGNCVMTNSTGAATFPLATSKAHVQNIDFAGSGTLTSMKGDQLEGYMVKDALNHFYATIEAATQAYNSANGPYTVLHDGTAPSGWKIDNATKKLIKIAKGLFFMAY